MTAASPHDHDPVRPGVDAQRATLAVARAVLAADPAAAHQAAGSGSCDACTVVAAVSFGFAMVASAAGEMLGLSAPLADRLAAAIAEAQQELDTGLN